MSYRLEDNGLTLRLFRTEGEALAHPNARSPTRYGCGWIARNEAGRWIDADGVLPPAWVPRPELIGAAGDGSEG